jgi:hypothetical protein
MGLPLVFIRSNLFSFSFSLVPFQLWWAKVGSVQDRLLMHKTPRAFHPVLAPLCRLLFRRPRSGPSSLASALPSAGAVT